MISVSKRQLKSLSNKSLSNKAILHDFMTKPYDDFEITIAPPNVKLYQGTDFDFTNKTIDEYYNYYNKRHNNAYFVSTQKTASLYGINLDFSNIIYTTVPDKSNIKYPTNKYDDIYPLYYIPGSRGYNITYKTKGNIILLDIGKANNIKKIWDIINELYPNKDDNENYKDILYSTVLKYDKTNGYNTFSNNLHRRSFDSDDDKLVMFFIDDLVPYFKKKYDITLNGWIYYKTTDNIFPSEICILRREEVLDFIEKTTLPESLYNDLPTRDQFLTSIEKRKIKNNSSIKSNTILGNFVQIQPSNKN